MSKFFKRYTALLLALLMCLGAFMFVSCEDTPDVSGDESTVGPDDTSDQQGSAPEDTEPPVVLGDFEITPEVKIIRPEKCDDVVKSAAEALAKAIQKDLGFTCKISTDWNDRAGAEIMVGNCSYREDSVEFNENFYPEGYGYAVLSEDVVAISANKLDNIYRAVKLFVTDVIEKKTVKIPVGSESLKGNERPDVNYTINGQPIESFVIVADDVRDTAAMALRTFIKKSLISSLDIVTPANYKGGNAIKIGYFGAESYFKNRYTVSSAVENGSVIVTIDGETSALRDEAVAFVTRAYMTTSLKNADLVIPESVSGYRTTANGGTKLYEVSSESTELAKGVTYYRKHYNNFEDKNVDVFITVVSGDSEAQFGTYVADFDTKSGKEVLDVRTVGAIASSFEATGVNVLAACNAGYFHQKEKTNYPYGMQIVKGEEIWAPNSADQKHADNWVGITKDGKMVCGNAKDYENTYKGKLEYGVACGSYIIKDGNVNFQRSLTGATCHTAVALTKDGGFVIICVDGRPEDRNGKSQGASAFDIITIFWELGLECTDAFILDGGGSTEMVLENGKYFYTQNDPSDGHSRPVSDIIAVIIP